MTDDKHAYQAITGFFIGDLIGQAVGRHQAIEDEEEFLRKVEADSSTLLHGMLHAQGFDHEVEADASAMEATEIALLKRFRIKNPYEIE